jgi:hypothetical protein
MSLYLFELEKNRQNVIIDVLKRKGMGKEMPMLSIPFLDWFNSYIFKNYSFIEIGSGYSTEYFYSRVKNIISYETKIDFYNLLKNKIDSNIDYRFISMKDLMHGNFELEKIEKTIVFIDNDLNRYRSSLHLINKVNPDIVILDNSESLPQACNMIYSLGYNEIPFWGIRPESPIEGCTSVFIKNNASIPEKNYDFIAEGTSHRKNYFEIISDKTIDLIIDGHEESERLGLPCTCNEIYEKIKSGELK